MTKKQNRPRLPEHLLPFIPQLKEMSTDELSIMMNGGNGKSNRKEDGNEVTLTYAGPKPITTKDKAIKFFDIDTDKFEVASFECKNWTVTMKNLAGEAVQATNYGLSLKLAKKAVELKFPEFKTKLRLVSKKKGTGSVLVPLSDFHIGAYVGDLNKTKDFTFDILCGYLKQIADDINKEKYANVHLQLLGDFIESFTGLNHINSWKGLSKGSYGMNAVILAHEILSKYLYTKINNLKSVDFVSGNHDRITSNNKEDVRGEVGVMIHYLFAKDFPSIDNQYSDLLVTRTVDGVCYISTHGHLGLAKKDTGKIVQDYGDSKANYHVFVMGHKHSRETTRSYKTSIAKYDDVLSIQHDSLDYRKVILPPLFTGNFYSEALGFSSTAGFSKMFVDKKGRFIHKDVTI